MENIILTDLCGSQLDPITAMASVKPLFIRIHFPEEVGPVRRQDLYDLQCNLQKVR